MKIMSNWFKKELILAGVMRRGAEDSFSVSRFRRERYKVLGVPRGFGRASGAREGARKRRCWLVKLGFTRSGRHEVIPSYRGAKRRTRVGTGWLGSSRDVAATELRRRCELLLLLVPTYLPTSSEPRTG